jgi:hypothetical protein
MTTKRAVREILRIGFTLLRQLEKLGVASAEFDRDDVKQDHNWAAKHMGDPGRFAHFLHLPRPPAGQKAWFVDFLVDSPAGFVW